MPCTVNVPRVVDPHWFNADPDPAFFLFADPDPVPNPGFWWLKIGKKTYFIFLGSKIAIYLSLGLYKGCTSYKRGLQPSEREHPSLPNLKILNFFLYLRVNFALLDPDPDRVTQINADPDPQPWVYLPDMKAELPGLLCVKNRRELQVISG
jgi:hypothetical protein